MAPRLLPLLVAGLLVLPGCSSDQATLTVLAASSLADAFEVVARDFEGAHPGVDVRISTAGSQQLATQVLQGAPADVFASADTTQMDRVVDAGLARDPVVFAHNELSIVATPAAPVRALVDLDDPDLDVVLAAPEVPAGRYARRVLEAIEVDVDPVSLEPSARAVLAKVALGEADAGIVYRSDLVATEDQDVREVRIPTGLNVAADYPAAVLADAPHPELARAFVEHLTGESARARLWTLGFTVEEAAP